MQRLGFAHAECPIARASDQIGDAWSLLVVRSALLGARTFQDFEARLGIPSSTLSRRLALLTEHGILERVRYRANPPRDEYVLTDKGEDLLSVILAIGAWGNRWLMPRGAAIEPVDEDGRAFEPRVVDRAGRRVRPGRVALRAGPAASARLREALPEPRVLGRRPS
jgi:DNA-binding HxlR family transcriptional regulator